MKATIIVTPKKSVLDPQGEAVRGAIHHMGMDCVTSARIGKFIELEISGSNLELTRTKLEEISRDLLSNPVIEDYELTLVADGAPAVVKAKLVIKKKIKPAIRKVKASVAVPSSAAKIDKKALKAAKKAAKAARKAEKKKKKKGRK